MLGLEKEKENQPQRQKYNIGRGRWALKLQIARLGLKNFKVQIRLFLSDLCLGQLSIFHPYLLG